MTLLAPLLVRPPAMMLVTRRDLLLFLTPPHPPLRCPTAPHSVVAGTPIKSQEGIIGIFRRNIFHCGHDRASYTKGGGWLILSHNIGRYLIGITWSSIITLADSFAVLYRIVYQIVFVSSKPWTRKMRGPSPHYFWFNHHRASDVF